MRPESTPVSNETLALIKEKRKLRRQYSQREDPAVKTRINQLQKQVKDDLRIESQASWEKFCNSITLETDSNESWRRIENFLKPKGQRDYPTLQHASKVAKINADKAQLLPNLSKGTLASRASILIRITSLRSTNSYRPSKFPAIAVKFPHFCLLSRITHEVTCAKTCNSP